MSDPAADRDPGADPTNPNAPRAPFDFDAFPVDTLFHERRYGRERRGPATPAGAGAGPIAPKKPPAERREKKERRRRIDPTTFEKQYTEDEMEFMNAMQRYKVQTGKAFPSHGEVLQVAYALGYRKVVHPESSVDPVAETSTLHPAGPFVEPLGSESR